LPNQIFNGDGFFMYMYGTTDGVQEMLFFPICNKNRITDTLDIRNNNLGMGISFQLPITGRACKIIKQNVRSFISSGGEIVHYKFSNAQIKVGENETYLYSKNDTAWTINIDTLKGKNNFRYFISNSCQVQSINGEKIIL